MHNAAAVSTRAFLFLQSVDPDALRHAIARIFERETGDVCLYQDARELDAPSGRLWGAYEASSVRVFLAQIDPNGPATPGWFAIETARPDDNGFADRPVATAVAAALGQRIIFRDPVPDPRDSPYVEAAQIGVDPFGREEELWLVEYGTDDGRDVTELLRRADL
jgi:hypothetical protein